MSLIDLASMVLAPTAVKDGKVYNAIPNDQDFTFSRGTEATRVNSAGLIEKARTNLLLQSNDFDTTWSSINTSETSGQSGYDGTNDAWLITKSAAQGRIQQSIATGGVQTLSVYAKAGSLNWLRLQMTTSNTFDMYYDLENGVLGSSQINAPIDATITSVGNDWYRCTITADETLINVRVYPADDDEDLSGTSGNILIQDAQLEQGLVSTSYIPTTTSSVTVGITDDLPRVDYSGGGCPSLLLEPQRTNLIPHSEYFGAWNKIGSPTITSNYGTSPDGLQNSTRIEGVNGDRIYIVAIGSSATYTYSIYAKGSGDIKLRDNSGTYNLSISLTSNWQRYDFSFTASFTNVQLQIDSTTDAEIWGAMVEAGSYSTSYIPTYGTSTSRSADSCTNADVSNFIGTSGTLFFHLKDARSHSATNKILGVGDGSGVDNFFGLYVSNFNTGAVGIRNRQANADLMNTAIPNPQNAKVAIKFGASGVKTFLNGSEFQTSSTAYTGWASSFDLNTAVGDVELKQYILFPTALTDEQCIALTTI